MRAVVQRVHGARVEVDGVVVGEIERGLCVFVGAAVGDEAKDEGYIVRKVANLRVFPDDTGKMSLSVKDIGGAVLAVSQFTVFGDVRKGRRPSFTGAMEPTTALPAYERFVTHLRAEGVPVQTGQFAADMRVLVDNDGPITILLDSRKTF